MKLLEYPKYTIMILTVFAAIYLVSGCSGQKDEVKETVKADPWDQELGEEFAVGRKIWMDNCKVCHGIGLGGAPILGNMKQWGPRIAKGKEVLYGNAINGFYGDVGEMPARGNNKDLTDEQVKAAVDFAVEATVKYNQ